jgi:hypothetical protein
MNFFKFSSVVEKERLNVEEISTSQMQRMGSKSPIFFRKQNTEFSENSAKEMQMLLEPMNS